ncbi:hypothetical protein U1Q18_034828 [Sarracenia purpurea var. burkii]
MKKSSDENNDTLNNKFSPFEVEKGAANDKDEDLEYNEEVDVESSIDDISMDMERNMAIDDLGVATTSNGNPPESASKYSLQVSDSPKVVKPCGRINSCMVVGRDTLYIYGGMMEVKDREIALDDLYTLNLSKLDEWKCTIPARKSDSRSLELGDAVAILKGEGKNLRRKEKRARIEQIRASLGLSDSQRTPMLAKLFLNPDLASSSLVSSFIVLAPAVPAKTDASAVMVKNGYVDYLIKMERGFGWIAVSLLVDLVPGYLFTVGHNVDIIAPSA